VANMIKICGLIGIFALIVSAKFAPNPSGTVEVEVGSGTITNIQTNGDYVITVSTPAPGDAVQSCVATLVYPAKLTVLDTATVPNCSNAYVEFFHKTKFVALVQNTQGYATLYVVDLSVKGFNVTKSVTFPDFVAVQNANSLVRKDKFFYFIAVDTNVQAFLYRVQLDQEKLSFEALTNITNWVASGNLYSFVISPDDQKLVLNIGAFSAISAQLVSLNITTGISDATASGLYYEIGYDNRESGNGYAITYNSVNQNLSYFQQWNFEELTEEPLTFSVPMYKLHAYCHTHTATIVIGVVEVVPHNCADDHVAGKTLVGQISFPDNTVYYLCGVPDAKAVGGDDFHVFVSNGNSTVYNYRVIPSS